MSLTFKVAENVENEKDKKRHNLYKYPEMTKVLGDFKLHIYPGEFTDSEIIVMLGQNGTGKTTFVKMLAGQLKADSKDQVITCIYTHTPYPCVWY